MARLSQTLACPFCGETMKVSKAKVTQKVCCPHCRQNVELHPGTDPIPESAWNVPDAAGELEKLLLLCKEKRAQIESVQAETSALEARAEALGEWLLTQKTALDQTPSDRAQTGQLTRLFTFLRPLRQGAISILDCDSGNEKSLAHHIRLAFEAFGWTVNFNAGSEPTHCGEEITFIVAPGPVDYPVAAVHIALQSAGFRLHSRMGVDQKEDSVLLCIHQISPIPRLLPAPRINPGQNPAADFRKSA